jgi:hypothetical protein
MISGIRLAVWNNNLVCPLRGQSTPQDSVYNAFIWMLVFRLDNYLMLLIFKILIEAMTSASAHLRRSGSPQSYHISDSDLSHKPSSSQTNNPVSRRKTDQVRLTQEENLPNSNQCISLVLYRQYGNNLFSSSTDVPESSILIICEVS